MVALNRSSPLARGLVWLAAGASKTELVGGGQFISAGDPATVFTGRTKWGRAYKSAVLNGTNYIAFGNGLIEPQSGVAKILAQHTMVLAIDPSSVTGGNGIFTVPTTGPAVSPYSDLAFGSDDNSGAPFSRDNMSGSQLYTPGGSMFTLGPGVYFWVRDGTFQGFYKDGVQFAATTGYPTVATDFSGSAAEVCINGFSSVAPTDSLICNVYLGAIYNRVLNQAEMVAISRDPNILLQKPFPVPLLIPTSTGTQTPKSVSGAITPAGAESELTNKNLGGGMTPAGTEAEQTNKNAGGSITPAGTESELTLKNLAGSMTPSGSETEQTNKNAGGSITPSGSLSRLVTRLLDGSITPSGAESEQTSKLLSGGITPTGSLTFAQIVTRTLIGAIAATGSLTRSITKALGGSVTPTSAQTKLVGFNLGGTMTSTGTLSTQSGSAVNLASAMTPTGALAMKVTKNLSGSIVPSGTLTKLVGFNLEGFLVPAGDTDTASGQSLSLGGTLVPSGTLRKRAGFTLVGVIGPTGALVTVFVPMAPTTAVGQAIAHVSLRRGVSSAVARAIVS